jgi:hypothetical protein
MAYVGDDFTHDVFFSYAHGDDNLREWSLKLAALIKSTLRTSLADREDKLDLFVDPGLKGNEQLGPQLKEVAQSSATQIVLMTGYYAKSEWCAREVQWFHEAVTEQEKRWVEELAGAPPTKRPGRVFVVWAQNVAGSQWPSLLRDGKETPTGYPCCDLERLSDQEPWVRPWGLLDREDKQREAVGKLSDQLASALYEMRRIGQERKALLERKTAEPGRARRPRVFVGFVTEDLEDERAALRDSLSNAADLEVVAPDRPVDVDDIRAEAAKLADDCEALVQLCGPGAGGWRTDADGFVLHQITQFEARRKPALLAGVAWLQLDRLRATSNYANLLRAKEQAGKLPRVPPTAAEVLIAIEAERRRRAPVEGGDQAAATLPECIVFIPSRLEYKGVEQGVREALVRQRKVNASVVPLLPTWNDSAGRDPRELSELRRRRAALIDGEFLILAGHPALEEDDFFELQKLRRQTALQSRLPVAIVDGVGGNAPIIPGFSLLKLTDSDFDAKLESWLQACATRQKTDPAP